MNAKHKKPNKMRLAPQVKIALERAQAKLKKLKPRSQLIRNLAATVKPLKRPKVARKVGAVKAARAVSKVAPAAPDLVDIKNGKIY